MKVALYARYSDDKQRAASIPDQLRLCRLFAEGRGWTVERDYTDPAITGSTLLLRPGIQEMMQDAMQHRFDLVLAESLDRISRDQEDTAALFKRLRFLRITFVTVGEGEITELHVGFKSTMNALYLKDLADKTRRGMRGLVEAGRSGGGLCYGYRVARADASEETTGTRTIEATEADVVRRIFRNYADGLSPQAIAKTLNREAVAAPGRDRQAPRVRHAWSASTIYGNWQRGTGILNNELYVGRMVWNRLRYERDPSTGKRVSRLNPASEWISSDVPHLRIVPDELWTEVKARQRQIRGVRPATEPLQAGLIHQRRPKYLFSRMTKCGVCGGGFYVYSGDRLSCFSARDRGTCDNRLTIRRQEVENRVLVALQEKLMRRDLFEEFCREFALEMNRLRMEARAGLSAKRHELERVEREIAKLIQAIKDGVPGREVREPLTELSDRKEILRRELQEAPARPPLLHPSMADLYREKVIGLRQALENEQSRPKASNALRGLLDAIVLRPVDGRLNIEVQGDLAAMLTFAQNAKRPSDVDDLNAEIASAVKMVAGAGFEPATFGL